MKKIFIIAMLVSFFTNDSLCMMTVHKYDSARRRPVHGKTTKNLGKITAIMRSAAILDEMSKNSEAVICNNADKAEVKKFVQTSFNDSSLCNVADKFFNLPKNRAIKALWMMDENQKFFLKVGMLPYEVKIFILSRLFNNHKPTSEQYCQFPYHEVLDKNLMLQLFTCYLPVSLAGTNTVFDCGLEHYFNLESDVTYLQQMARGEPVERLGLTRALSTIRTIEEEKMNQRAFNHKNYFCEQVIAEPFKFTVNMLEEECGIERLRVGGNNISLDDMFARWLLACPVDRLKFEKEIFLTPRESLNLIEWEKVR